MGLTKQDTVNANNAQVGAIITIMMCFDLFD